MRILLLFKQQRDIKYYILLNKLNYWLQLNNFTNTLVHEKNLTTFLHK